MVKDNQLLSEITQLLDQDTAVEYDLLEEIIRFQNIAAELVQDIETLYEFPDFLRATNKIVKRVYEAKEKYHIESVYLLL